MKRLVLALLALLGIALAVAGAAHFLASSHPAENRGSAVVVSQNRTLPPFSRVIVEGMVDIELIQGPDEGITIEAPGRATGGVKAEVRDGTLTVESSGREGWFGGAFGGTRTARVVVRFRTLEHVRASGAVKIHADDIKAGALGIDLTGASSIAIGRLVADSLAVSGSGAMKAEIAGRAARQTIDISGAGAYRAADFLTDAATVSVSGAGKVTVNVARTLDVRISGAGAVDYLGDPKVREEVSGVGRVRRRDSASAAGAAPA
jgi:hypothetical protein